MPTFTSHHSNAHTNLAWRQWIAASVAFGGTAPTHLPTECPDSMIAMLTALSAAVDSAQAQADAIGDAPRVGGFTIELDSGRIAINYGTGRSFAQLRLVAVGARDSAPWTGTASSWRASWSVGIRDGVSDPASAVQSAELRDAAGVSITE